MPLILLLFLLLLSPLQAEGRFEADIEKLEARPISARGGTVFIGSSTFTLWGDGLEREFADFQAINRGFGGSTLPEVIEYVPRILLPLEPRNVVVYCGTNDLAEGRTPAQVSEDFRRLVELIRAHLPKTRIAYVSLSLPPSRVHLADKFAQTNTLIADYVQSTPALYFIDVSKELLDEQGQPRREFFREDALHMTQAGYDRWIPKLRQALEEMEKAAPSRKGKRG